MNLQINTNPLSAKLKSLLLCILLLFIASCGFAQKKIQVIARGSYEARDLTLEEVKNKAVEAAKQNAMVKAGISENVMVTDFLYTFEDNDKFHEIFQSFVSTETGADIIVEDIKEINRDINEFGNILIEVEIKAVIYKHKEDKDPTFNFKVTGIKEVYYLNDPLVFGFEPASNGYLKIFNVTDHIAFILYPYHDPDNSYLNDKHNRLFQKNKKVYFPINSYIDGYYFDIDKKNENKEYNLLIFVYTKQDIPFLEDLNVANIMKWIYEIPLDERIVKQYGIVVRK